jgi:hypothetical protein
VEDKKGKCEEARRYIMSICDEEERDEYIPYILESNPHLVFAIFLNEKS